MTDRHPVIPPGHESTYARFGFAPAFRAGNTVYVSGVIGRGADGKVPADEAAEYASVFESLAVVLEAAGGTIADIVELVSYHVDLHASLPAFMAAKGAAIREPYPAWTAIGCTALAAPGARVEVRAVAVLQTDG